MYTIVKNWLTKQNEIVQNAESTGDCISESVIQMNGAGEAAPGKDRFAAFQRTV